MKERYEYISALMMLAAGIALSVAGFIVPPLGEIADSTLWFLAQCLMYAGGVFGVKTYVRDLTKKQNGIDETAERKLPKEEQKENEDVVKH